MRVNYALKIVWQALRGQAPARQRPSVAHACVGTATTKLAHACVGTATTKVAHACVGTAVPAVAHACVGTVTPKAVHACVGTVAPTLAHACVGTVTPTVAHACVGTVTLTAAHGTQTPSTSSLLSFVPHHVSPTSRRPKRRAGSSQEAEPGVGIGHFTSEEVPGQRRRQSHARRALQRHTAARPKVPANIPPGGARSHLDGLLHRLEATHARRAAKRGLPFLAGRLHADDVVLTANSHAWTTAATSDAEASSTANSEEGSGEESERFARPRRPGTTPARARRSPSPTRRRRRAPRRSTGPVLWRVPRVLPRGLKHSPYAEAEEPASPQHRRVPRRRASTELSKPSSDGVSIGSDSRESSHDGLECAGGHGASDWTDGAGDDTNNGDLHDDLMAKLARLTHQLRREVGDRAAPAPNADAGAIDQRSTESVQAEASLQVNESPAPLGLRVRPRRKGRKERRRSRSTSRRRRSTHRTHTRTHILTIDAAGPTRPAQLPVVLGRPSTAGVRARPRVRQSEWVC